jgi:hypothetical protein
VQNHEFDNTVSTSKTECRRPRYLQVDGVKEGGWRRGGRGATVLRRAASRRADAVAGGQAIAEEGWAVVEGGAPDALGGGGGPSRSVR